MSLRFSAYPYLVRYSNGGTSYVTAFRTACDLVAPMRKYRPKVYLRTTIGSVPVRKSCGVRTRKRR